MKKAFTMIELVIVMVVMGIIASIGADIVASMYNNYLRSRTVSALESKTEIALEQIAKRLQYRIKESVIARKQTNGTILPLSSQNNALSTYDILEWISYSNESFLGTPRPGWSGFIDLENNDTIKPIGTDGTLKTSESNLSQANALIFALTNGGVDLSVNGKEAALVFKGKAYNHTDFGWNTTNNTDGNATVKVRQNGISIDTLAINEANVSEVYEQYYLAHTAYAIVPTYTTAADFTLFLHYNYQPWLANGKNDYDDANTSKSILAEHASLFRFKQDDSLVHLKLCLHDNNETGIGDKIVVCKEKVVY